MELQILQSIIARFWSAIRTLADPFPSVACCTAPPVDGVNPQATPDVDNHGSSCPRAGKHALNHGEEDLTSCGNSQLWVILTMLQLWTTITAIRYAFPAVVFLYFIAALAITVCTLQTQRLRIKDEHVRRDVILGLIFGVTATYVCPLCLTRRQKCFLSRLWQKMGSADFT